MKPAPLAAALALFSITVVATADMQCNDWRRIEFEDEPRIAICSAQDYDEAQVLALQHYAAGALSLISCPGCKFPASACSPAFSNPKPVNVTGWHALGCWHMTIHEGSIDVGCTWCPPL
jgi:hypothetical protein